MPELGNRAKTALLIVAAAFSLLFDFAFRLVAVLLLGLILFSLESLKPGRVRLKKAKKAAEGE